MVRHLRAPGVENRRDTDAGPKMLGIGGDRQHRLGRRPEQDVVDHLLVLIRQVGDRSRHREHHVIVRHRKQLGLALGQPFPGSRALALGAVAVAAAIVANNGVRTSLAAGDVATERRRPAGLDRRDRSELAEADVPFVGCAPRRSMGAEYVRHLHGALLSRDGCGSSPQTARQELLSGYRALRSGRPIGSDFVP